MTSVRRIQVAALLAAVTSFGCQSSFAECGIASTYSTGALTANGERYHHMGISAAHKSLPFGTRVVVRNQRTGHSITVRINDRGPFVAGRIIDLSTGAKNALGMDGLAPVCLEVVSYGGRESGFRTPGLHEASASRTHHASRRHHEAEPHHYARSTARVRFAHQGRSHRSVSSRPAHRGDHKRLLASN